MPDEAPLEWSVADGKGEDAFSTANLFPRDTGLPMTVWIGERSGARRDVRVTVSKVHGQRVLPDDRAVIAVRPEPRLLHGDLASRDLTLVAEWVKLNAELIVDHWEGRASTLDIARRLRRLPG